MKNILIYLIAPLLVLVGLYSCEKDEPSGKSILRDTTKIDIKFDQWLIENYIEPYNVSFKYRLDDKESDFNYNVVAASLENSIKMAFLIQYLWYDAYNEVAPENFMKIKSPRVLHIIGSNEWNISQGTVRLGTAEGGVKITLTAANNMNLDNAEELNDRYFNTLHHEFAHILHQDKLLPNEFKEITPSTYSNLNWNLRTDEEAVKLGYVSAYAGSEAQEDFVEVIARYITTPDAKWNAMMQSAGVDGAEFIKRKLVMCTNYLAQSWGISIDELHKEVQERMKHIDSLNLDAKVIELSQKIH